MSNLKKITLISVIALMSIYCFILNNKINTLDKKVYNLTKELQYQISLNDSLMDDNTNMFIDILRYELILSRIEEKYPNSLEEASKDIE